MKKILLFTCLILGQICFAQSSDLPKLEFSAVVQQLMTIPNTIDTDQDGTLSIDEVMMAPENLKLLDQNGDGALDWKEMGAYEKQLPLVRNHNITNLIDENGDIHISAEEIINAAHVLTQLDFNGDWHISKKELNFNKNPKAPIFSLKSKMIPDEWFKKFRGYTLKNEGPILPGENEKQYKGYTLIHESGDGFLGQMSNDTYLLDENGKRIHTWKHNGYSPEGSVAYLLENGQLLRTYSKYGWVYDKQFPVSETTTIELVDWDGNVIWDYTNVVPRKHAFHHDVDYMPNGNILAIRYNAFSLEEAEAMGWNRSLGEKTALKIKNNYPKQAMVWMCSVLEIDPNLQDGSTEIVWEWNTWDHYVQDLNPLKSNFGDVTNKNKINLNYLNLDEGVLGNVGQFHHLNAVDYNPELDLIILGSPTYGEFWIIDHSTSSTEAKGSSGGKYQKGGDILYRWGNPHAIGEGSLDDKNLYWQHDVQWINPGLPGAGNVLIYNNGGRRTLEDKYNTEFKLLNFGNSYTEIVEVDVPINDQGHFISDGKGEVVWSWTAENKAEYFSPFMSGVMRLPNGNTIFCRAYDKYLIEVTPEGDKVLDFSIPGWGRLYRIYKYGNDYSGLKF